MAKKLFKYYLGEVKECYGEFTADCKFIFSVTSGQRVDRVARRLSKEWRGLKPAADGFYWFDGNCHEAVEYREIPAEDFAVLARYLTDLTIGKE